MKPVLGSPKPPGPLPAGAPLQPLKLRLPEVGDLLGPEGLGSRPLLQTQKLAPRLLKEDLARIDNFLALHGFGVGDGLRPMLDSKITTLDAIVSAAHSLVLSIIPRSDVERIINGRWNGMVLDRLLHPRLLPVLIKNIFEPGPPPPPQTPSPIMIVAPPTGHTSAQAGQTLTAFKVKVTQKVGGPIVPDNTPVTWSVPPLQGTLLVPSPGTVGGEATAILTLAKDINEHADVTVLVTVSSPGLESKVITVHVRPKPNIALGKQIAWHAALAEGDKPESPDHTIQIQFSEDAKVQRVVQISYNIDTKQSQVLVGGQVNSPELELVDELLKVSAFVQIMAGIAWTGSTAAGTMILQPSAGVQLQLSFGPVQITMQAGPGFTIPRGDVTTGDFNVTPFQVTVPF
jgi:hypothetical protein